MLCGGGTKIPKLRDAIQDKLANADMLSSINGDEVIALGAARQVKLVFSNKLPSLIDPSFLSATSKANIRKLNYQK